ncbi:sensor histidine kinase [Sulfidibacter corallicola]|uniref:histidine kinase n=1 Tax=Sulfidibacter corallicola TaxID=2818388 RepID=A0A8A4TNY5_SULCO|nr:HAMP domain-containing sensor histidine kinase [Sulfidibacter corallicola]QTD50668.1 HAMP domain-containing histidine kinase [Sulfidibacter corallicola]
MATGLFCLPLAVLLLMQYRWLTHMETVNREAERANMSHYLDIVAEKTENHYRLLAAGLVQVPADLLTGDLAPILLHYRSIPREKLAPVSYLFHMSFVGDRDRETYLFDPQTGDWAAQVPDSYYKKVNLAGIHWWAWHQKKLDGAPEGLVTSHYLPNQPIIMHLIPDENGEVIGLAGMVLDDDYFGRFLADIVPDTLNATFPGRGMRAEVLDGTDVRRLETETIGAIESEDKVVRPFSWVFQDWRVAIHRNGGRTSGLAETTVMANGLVSLALAIILALGVLFSMRTAVNYRQLSDMKSDFVSNVSHELRTPIASIRVFSELMRDGKIGSMEKVVEYGTVIEQETRRLGGLIENILDFSKIESGQKQYVLEETDLVGLAEAIVQGFEQRPDLAGIRFARTFPEQVPALPLDRGAIGQALFNLLDNAIKYGPATQTIEVGVRLEETRASVWVKDQSGGIPVHERERVFDRFHRVHTGAVHQVRGSGLGLAITKHIAEGHGGRIALTCEEGVGSCFEIYLPFGGKERGCRAEKTGAVG